MSTKDTPEPQNAQDEAAAPESPRTEAPEHEAPEERVSEQDASDKQVPEQQAPDKQAPDKQVPEQRAAAEPDEMPARLRHPLPAEAAPEPESGPEPEATAEVMPPAALTGRQRLVKGLWPPRLTRAQLIVALLLFGLGLGLAIQVRTTSDNGALRGARQEDLVRILSELDTRTQRLEDEKRGLDTQRAELQNSSDQAAEARRQTEQKAQQLGVLAGTVAAQGPGITVTIRESGGTVAADELLDTLQELRAAGAEAIQINDVRAVAGTYFTDAPGGVQIDGHKVTPPYVFKVVGNPPDLEPALNIPGGVVQTLEKEQATVSVVRSQKIVVDALRSVKQPDYARSSGQ